MAHILIIEDDDLFRRMLRATLEQEGHVVTEARNGSEGIAKHRDSAPDVVITDLIMPEKEGLETIIELRETCPGVRVIAMSGGGRGLPAGYLNLAQHLGAVRVLAKPFPREAILKAIREVLGSEAAAEGS
jgi:CheY-like chemotaxis protein